MYSWGWASFQGSKKMTLSNSASPSKVLQLDEIFYASGGRRHTCVISVDHKLYTWGIGENGQLGHGNLENQELPKQVPNIEGNPVKVSAGWGHNILLLDTGIVYTWGFGDDGALGHGNFHTEVNPKKVKPLENIKIVDISAGSDFSLFLDENGNVYCCGAMDLDSLTNKSMPTMINFGIDVKIKALASGLSHALAISSEGVLYSFGWNSDGQLGIGSQARIGSPVIVEGINEKVEAISAGRVHSVCSGGKCNVKRDQSMLTCQ